MEKLDAALEAQLAHFGGEGCVVRYQYGSKVVTYALQVDTPENEAWQDAAFTNGPPLVKITIEFAPDEAKALTKP